MIKFAQKLVRILFLTVLLVCMAGSALLVIQVILPGLLESKLLPRIADRIGIQELGCRIRRIGFTGTEMGPVTMGPAKAPALSVDTLLVEYRPIELFQGEVQNVRLSGVRLQGAFQDGVFSFPGLNFKQVEVQENRKPAVGADPFPIGRIQVRSAEMVIDWQNDLYRIPFELDLRPDKNNLDKIKGLLRFYPRGQKLDLAITANFGDEKKAELTLHANDIDLQRFADIGNLVPGLDLKGKVDISAGAGIAFSPFFIDTLKAEMIWKKGSASLPGLKITTGSFSNSSIKPLKLSLEKKEKNIWNLHADHFVVAFPVPVKLADLYFSFDATGNKYKAAGRFRSEFAAGRGLLTPAGPVKTLWEMRADREKNGKWSAEISNKVLKSSSICTLETGKASLKSSLPLLTISAAGTRHNGGASWKLSLQDLELESPDAGLVCPAIDIKGSAAFSRSEQNVCLTATVDADMSHIRISAKKIQIDLPQLSFSGEIKKKGSGKPHFNGMLKFAKANLGLRESHTRLQGITGNIPFAWPPAKPVKRGNFSISNILHRERALGAMKSTVSQNKTGAVFSAVHENSILSGLKLFASGRLNLKQKSDQPLFKIDFRVPDWVPAAGFDLGKVLPEAKGVVAGGCLSAKGKLFAGSYGLQGSAEVAVKQGFLQSDDKKILIDGIEMALCFPELPSVRSGAGQQLEFKRAAIGDIAVNDGKIDFQLEPGNSLLIEKSTFVWCKGNIDTQALRISPGNDRYRLILYCDRLRIAGLLEQLCTVKAEGKGTVNGRIPIEYENGKLRFSDGFLYSTPGDGGRIRLSNTEMITAGLPVDTPRFAQLDLAREALKDYEYKWAKLSLNSKRQTLFFRLQFDGRPMGPLPFVYKKELGGFARVDAKSKGSLFQGISLDVNLQLPLNQILSYKDNSLLFE